MDQRLNFVTVATADLDAARVFYTVLGWSPLLDVDGEVLFYQVAPGLLLGFFTAEKFAQDLGAAPGPTPVSGVTLSHNVDSPDQVRRVVARLQEAGGTVVKAPQHSEFGGIFHAHVRDPNGVVWEVAHNPGWSVAADGRVVLA